MSSAPFLSSCIALARYVARWCLLAVPVSVFTGALVALFLRSLDAVTAIRWQHPWLLWLLPLAGIVIHFAYKAAGRNAERGNNLLIDEIHQPGGGVPGRMAPLVLASTLVTHLFGGSAGREGTAVQMGGSVAGLLARWLRLSPADVSILLTTGIAAGFGAVFGTPAAGAVFALEVLGKGTVSFKAILPCLFAAQLGNLVCMALGAHHMHYAIGNVHLFSLFSLQGAYSWLGVLLAGIAFGLAARLFIVLSHTVSSLAQRLVPGPAWLIPFSGGVLVIAITAALGTYDYLGIGVVAHTQAGVSIASAFTPGVVAPVSWLWKLLLTAITLGTGFKGGEVTPLFFIGATLGSALAALLGLPVPLFAALGFIAVFAGAANTPLACILMGVELFGAAHVVPFTVVCFAAFYSSGQGGIYKAQRIHRLRSVAHRK